MTRQQLRSLKILRISSQTAFFGLFVYIFIRSLDPFSRITNPFLRFDPLILLTHLQFHLKIILPILGLLLLTVILGRFFCGWICPLGSLIDTLDFIIKPIRKINPFLKRKNSRGSDNDRLKNILMKTPTSWFILGGVLITVFFTPPVLQFFHPNVWMIRIFSLSGLGIVFLSLLFLSSVFTRRFWCKYICPVGALYGLISKVSLFKLSIIKCTGCGRCSACPMDAADYHTETIFSHQCILCFDYEYQCPIQGFSFQRITGTHITYNESRRRFLKTGSLFIGGLLFGSALSIFDRTRKTMLLRPPGVEDESLFVQRCLRCFQCVESCPNKIIKITGLDAGIDSVFTPHLEFQEYGCDYNCQVCQIVCPNFAIPKQTLEEKQKTKIGLASINENTCVVFVRDTNCLVCEEFCPIPEKAISIIEKTKTVNGEQILLKYPVVENELCIGCGICEAYCPVESKAIKVYRI